VDIDSWRLAGVTRFNKAAKEWQLRWMGRTTSAPDFRLNSTLEPSEIRVSMANARGIRNAKLLPQR